MENYFFKYQNDILIALKNIHESIDFNNIPLLLNEKASSLILDILNSYYFEDSFKASLLNESEISTIYFNKKLSFSPFIEINKFKKFQDFKNLSINLDTIKEELKKIDPFYSIIFEKNKLKQDINLIKKHEIHYSIIKVDDNVYEKIKPFHKISDYKNIFENENLYNKKYHFEEEIKNVIGIEFFTLNNVNRHFVVAHNNNQIVGVTSLTKFSSPFNDEEKKHFIYDKFIFNSYVAVAKQFRGQNISIGMMEKAINFSLKNNLILVRSQSTEDGKLYIEKKIDNLISCNKNIISIKDELKSIIWKIKPLLISIKKENDYIKFLDEFKPFINEITEELIIKNNLLKNIEDYTESVNICKESEVKLNNSIENFKAKFSKKTFNFMIQ